LVGRDDSDDGPGSIVLGHRANDDTQSIMIASGSGTPVGVVV
jgi:hypothetical protein